MTAAAWLSVAATTIAAPFAATTLATLLHDLDARRQQRTEQEWLDDWHHGPSGIHDIHEDEDPTR